MRDAARGLALLVVLGSSACMVGPDYQTPPAPVGDAWVDTNLGSLSRTPDVDYGEWWKSFRDPALDELMQLAYAQNLSLEIAGLRVVEAVARRGVAIGQLYPQVQEVGASYARQSLSESTAQFTPFIDPSFNNFTLAPLGAAWEIDLWGRFRRNIESADADLVSSLYGYQDALVSLLAEVATAYMRYRTLEEQLEVARTNVELQARSVEIVRSRFDLGAVTELDLAQARSLLRDTQSLIPGIEASLVQARDQISFLLGLPPSRLDSLLAGDPRIPDAPEDVIVGLPAELLRMRPDVRQAERLVAAQSARIGIAAADFYPRLELVGELAFQAEEFGDLFQGKSFSAFGGPQFRWAILNYGRIVNNVRVQDAVYQQQIRAYENAVLGAQQEVQDAMAGYLGALRQVEFLELAVADSARAVELAEYQYREGATDYTRVLLSQQFLLEAAGRLVGTRGSVALNLVSLHRSLGGGWQFHEGEALIRPETRQEMEDRVRWGDLLETEEEYDDIEAADGSEKESFRFWWPEW